MTRIFYYKGIRVDAFGIPIWTDKTRAKKDHRKKKFYHASFSSPFAKDSPKNLVIMYDVREGKKKERDWLRRQLIKFGYKMIQRSVWVGPSPLPHEFSGYLKAIGLQSQMRVFKLARPYTGKENRI